jgi:DNA-binding MarR family transcriptional regulator
MAEDRATTLDAHDDAVAAMLELRTAGARLFDLVTEAQELAPHHLFALQAVTNGCRSLGDVASATDRHVSSVSRTVDQLVHAELVERAEDPEDRRQVVLRTTAEGDDVIGRFARLDAALMGRIVRSLPADEAAAIARLLRRMAREASAVFDEVESDPAALQRLT